MASRTEFGSQTPSGWKAFLNWLLPPEPPGTSKQQALEIGRRFHEEQGWHDATNFLIVEESAYRDGDAVVDTFEVSSTLTIHPAKLHVRRSDGKVLGVVTVPR